jgi:nucleotide-binding universal stress UspA family protein
VIDNREIEPALTNLTDNIRTEREELYEEMAQGAIDSVCDLARAHLSGRITTAIERGIPFQEIADYVDTHGIDIVVMGTHGRTGLERFLIGSVTEKVLRTVDVPVIAVPPDADEAEPGKGEYSDILLPTDSSEGAEVAVDWGISLAKIYDSTVHTVYSVDTSRFVSVADTADIYESLEKTGEEALEAVREQASSVGVSVAGSIGTGPAAQMILTYSDDHDIDMIVMGTHGRSGVNRYLIGSVTESVLRSADVPVCCVPMEEL